MGNFNILPNYALCLFCTQAFPIDEMKQINLQGREMLTCIGCYDRLDRGSIVKPDLTILNMYIMMSVFSTGQGDVQQQMLPRIRKQFEKMISSPEILLPYATQLTSAIISHVKCTKEETMEVLDWFMEQLKMRCMKGV